MALALARVEETRETSEWRINRQQMAKLDAYLALSPLARERKREQVRRRWEFEAEQRKHKL